MDIVSDTDKNSLDRRVMVKVCLQWVYWRLGKEQKEGGSRNVFKNVFACWLVVWEERVCLYTYVNNAIERENLMILDIRGIIARALSEWPEKVGSGASVEKVALTRSKNGSSRVTSMTRDAGGWIGVVMWVCGSSCLWLLRFLLRRRSKMRPD